MEGHQEAPPPLPGVPEGASSGRGGQGGTSSDGGVLGGPSIYRDVLDETSTGENGRGDDTSTVGSGL